MEPILYSTNCPKCNTLKKEDGDLCPECGGPVISQWTRIVGFIDKLVSRYLANPVSKALVISGLEPFDDFGALLSLIKRVRERCQDPVIIYSGYYPEEVSE